MADHTTVARPYARAVFDVAQASGDLAGWSIALGAAAAVVRDADARGVLNRPQLRALDKAGFVESIAAEVEGAGMLRSDAGRNLLALLAENDRLDALPELAAQFDELKTRADNRIKVTFVSATEVDDAQAAQVKAALEKKLGREVGLTLEVDAALMGGAVVRADDMVIDGSVRSRLARLADALAD